MYEWNLADFEEMMFRHLREVNFEELIDDHSDEKKVSLDDQIAALKAKFQSNEVEISKAIDFSISPNFSNEIQQRFLGKISQLDKENKLLKNSIDSLLKQVEEENESQKIYSDSALKQLLEQIETKQDDYMFRSTLNQFLLKMIDKIYLAEPEDTSSPSDYDEDDAEVKAFRLTFKIRRKWTLDEIQESAEFEQFRRQYNRMVLVKYRSGAERVLSCGHDASFNFDSKVKSPVEII